jgi:hypothetical protein
MGRPIQRGVLGSAFDGKGVQGCGEKRPTGSLAGHGGAPSFGVAGLQGLSEYRPTGSLAGRGVRLTSDWDSEDPAGTFGSWLEVLLCLSHPIVIKHIAKSTAASQDRMMRILSRLGTIELAVEPIVSVL